MGVLVSHEAIYGRSNSRAGRIWANISTVIAEKRGWVESAIERILGWCVSSLELLLHVLFSKEIGGELVECLTLFTDFPYNLCQLPRYLPRDQ